MTKQASLLNSEAPEAELSKTSATKEQTQRTVGHILRAAREEQGVDIGLLASSLKVSIRQLALLESDQYDSLPDVAFTRNFAISVAKRLKVDEALIAELLPKMDSAQMASAVVKLSHDARGTVMKDEVLTGRKRSKFWWLLLVGLVLVLLGLVFLMPQWGSGRSSEGGRSLQNSNSVSEPVQITPVRMQPISMSVSQGMVGVPRLGGSFSEPAVMPHEERTSEALVALPEAVESELGVSSAASVQVSSAELSADVTAPVAMASEVSNKLEIRTRTQSWVSVKAASGKTLYESMLKGDAFYSLLLRPEELPVSIRIGRANDAIVTVRGAVLNLSSYIVGDIANFKVE